MPRAKKPLTEELLARRREKARERKARERARMGADGRREQQKIDTKACFDWARVKPHLRPVTAGTNEGCVLWTGAYSLLFGKARPLLRAGQYGRQYADVVVWCLTNKRKELPRGSFLKRTCGNLRCVAAHHGVPTNIVVERVKAARLAAELRRRGEADGDLRKEAQGPEGQRQSGRLPRAV
jgi:hypothetical protein